MITSTRCSPCGSLSSLLNCRAVSFIGRYSNAEGQLGIVAIQSLRTQHLMNDITNDVLFDEADNAYPDTASLGHPVSFQRFGLVPGRRVDDIGE